MISNGIEYKVLLDTNGNIVSTELKEPKEADTFNQSISFCEVEQKLYDQYPGDSIDEVKLKSDGEWEGKMRRATDGSRYEFKLDRNGNRT